MSRSIFLIAALALTCACTTINAPRYASAPDVSTRLRALHAQRPGAGATIGQVEVKLDDPTEVSCAWGVSIRPPDGQTFAAYFAGALGAELQASGISPDPTHRISGEIQSLDLARFGGEWTLAGTINLGGTTLPIHATAEFSSGAFEANSCQNAGAALMNLTQELAKQIFGSSQFERLLEDGPSGNI